MKPDDSSSAENAPWFSVPETEKKKIVLIILY